MTRPGQHRQTRVRPRYARLAVAVASLAVTTIAVLGGTGVLPVPNSGDAAQASGDLVRHPTGKSPTKSSDSSPAQATSSGVETSADSTESRHDPKVDSSLPSGSGTGKRIVFSQSRQRVWLVTGGKHVARTYPVSGSVYDNLHPGTYAVYSRSEDAWGVDDSGSMKYFVRFTQGDTGAAIGFHDIPIKDGQLVQTEAQLGTPLSHGCIRQRRADAIALWKFAPLGTTVVVTT